MSSESLLFYISVIEVKGKDRGKGLVTERPENPRAILSFVVMAGLGTCGYANIVRYKPVNLMHIRFLLCVQQI